MKETKIQTTLPTSLGVILKTVIDIEARLLALTSYILKNASEEEKENFDEMLNNSLKTIREKLQNDIVSTQKLNDNNLIS